MSWRYDNRTLSECVRDLGDAMADLWTSIRWAIEGRLFDLCVLRPVDRIALGLGYMTAIYWVAVALEWLIGG